MADQDGDVGKSGIDVGVIYVWTPQPGVEKAPSPYASHSMRNVTTLMESGRQSSRWTARETECSSRRRKVSEAKAIRRKTKGKHNLIDRVLPTLKDG